MLGNNNMFGSKKTYIEALRIFAICMIIYNHTTSWGFDFYIQIVHESPLYWIYMSMSILCKMAVPIFWMISGSLLLGKEESLSVTIKKRLFRFVYVILIFSFLQYLYNQIYCLGEPFSFKRYIVLMLTTTMANSYWFLYSYAALILMLPFLRKIATNLSNQQYLFFIALNILFQGIIPIIQYVQWRGERIFVPDFNPIIASHGFICYPLIGYFIDNRVPEKYFTRKNLLLLIILSILSVAITCAAVYYQASVIGHEAQTFYMALITIPTCSTFLIVKYIYKSFTFSTLFNKLVTLGGNCAFGVMLLENIGREQTIGFMVEIKNLFNLPQMFACLLWVFLTFIVCSAATLCLKKIPLLNKLL